MNQPKYKVGETVVVTVSKKNGRDVQKEFVVIRSVSTVGDEPKYLSDKGTFTESSMTIYS